MFLNIWEYLMEIIDFLTYSEKSLAFDVILLIMRRREFDPVYFKHTHTRLKKSFVKSLIRAIVPSLDQLEHDILRQFNYVSYRTQRYV
ncbi:argS, partial [Acrasis kona]